MPIDRFVWGTDVLFYLGSYLFVMGPLLTFAVLLIQISREKDNNLRKGLSVVGVSHAAFWLSWCIVAVAISVLQSFILVITGKLCQLPLFLNTPFLWLYFVMFSFSFAMVGLSFFMSTLVPNSQIANNMSYSVILIVIIVQLIFTLNELVFSIFYNDRTRTTFMVTFVRSIFYIVPTFTFSVLFGGMTRVCGTHLSSEDLAWIPGKVCTWSDFYAESTGPVGTGDTFTVPSSCSLLFTLLGVATMYYVLAWYCDHVISSNRGVSSTYLFFFKKDYWKSVFGIESKKNI